MASASSSGRPDLPAELNERGLRCKAAGRLTEARQCYERARDLLRLEEPVDYSALATVYHNLGGIAFVLGAYASGELMARKGIALRLQAAKGPEALAADLIALAALIGGQDRFDEAEQLYRSGLTVLRATPHASRAEIAVALHGLGVQYARRGRRRRALRFLRRAARIKVETLGPAHPSLELTLRSLTACGGMDDADDRARCRLPGPVFD